MEGHAIAAAAEVCGACIARSYADSDKMALAHVPASSFLHHVQSNVFRRCVECVLTFNPGLPHGAALAPSDRVWCLGVKSEARAVTFQLILSLHNRRHLRWGLASAVQGRVGPYAALEFVADFKQDSFEAFRAQLVIYLPSAVSRARARTHTHTQHTHTTHTHDTHTTHTRTHTRSKVNSGKSSRRRGNKCRAGQRRRSCRPERRVFPRACLLQLPRGGAGVTV